MRILSFDPASQKNLGWAVIDINMPDDPDDTEDGGEFVCRAGTMVMPSMSEPWQYCYPLGNAIESLFVQEDPDMVILEKTNNFKGGFITAQVSACIGIIYYFCGQYDTDVGHMWPSTCKKIITGSGKAKKKDIKKAVKEILALFGIKDVKYDSEHSYDAVAVALSWLIQNENISID